MISNEMNLLLNILMIQILLRKLLKMETKKGLKCDLREFFEDISINSLERYLKDTQSQSH